MLINSSVNQQGVVASYNATPQSCPASGGSLPIQTVTSTLRNNSALSFSGLFFQVRQVEYTTAQGGQQPILCNPSHGNGGVGSLFLIADSSLAGGNSQLDPGEELAASFQIGLPVRAQYRFFVDLYSAGAAAATLDGGAPVGDYLGRFEYTLDADSPLSGQHMLFLPLINR